LLSENILPKHCIIHPFGVYLCINNDKGIDAGDRGTEQEKIRKMKTFNELVEIGTTPATSDLEHAIQGLLLFAKKNANQEDIDTFMDWLGEDQNLMEMRTVNTTPGDHFECAVGKTWVEMEMYRNACPKNAIMVSELKGTEPNVRMWVDSSSIYWISENQGLIWIDEHRGIEDFIDETHQMETRYNMGEGVGNEGVEWNNTDFENPFHISDFTEKIETINHFHF